MCDFLVLSTLQRPKPSKHLQKSTIILSIGDRRISQPYSHCKAPKCPHQALQYTILVMMSYGYIWHGIFRLLVCVKSWNAAQQRFLVVFDHNTHPCQIAKNQNNKFNSCKIQTKFICLPSHRLTKPLFLFNLVITIYFI